MSNNQSQTKLKFARETIYETRIDKYTYEVSYIVGSKLISITKRAIRRNENNEILIEELESLIKETDDFNRHVPWDIERLKMFINYIENFGGEPTEENINETDII